MENTTREQDIQNLCEAVLNVCPNFWDNPNGAYENTCPFCGVTERRGGGKESGYGFASMGEIPHLPDCAYLIAKDLRTK